MLTAVCLDIHDETLTLAATDRYRLAVRDVRWAPAVPGLRAVALVPARTLADVGRSMTAGVPVTVAFGAGQSSTDTVPAAGPARDPRPADGVISFQGGSRRLTARLLGGEFIRYESRFPAGFGSRATLPAGLFTEAVRRVSLVADRASPVRLTFDSGNVVIEAQTDGRARAVETVPADFEGEERLISFNPHYLLDGLGAASASAAPARHAGAPGDVGEVPSAEAGRIRLEFSSAAKPALITWAVDEGLSPEDSAPAFRYLVVPLRVPARA
jgi:DNA polymerase-3 subunit beta